MGEKNYKKNIARRGSRLRRARLTRIVLCALILCMIPCAVSAVQKADTGNKVTKAHSLKQYIKLTEPDLEDTESKYGLKRVLVSTELEDPEETFGAESAVVYDGRTLLTFDSKSTTKKGYRQLLKTYGEEGVFLDKPMTVDSVEANEEASGSESTNAQGIHGWGTQAMYLDYEKEQFAGSDQKVTVAVLDSGINPDHEIFANTAISPSSINIIDPSASWADDYGHGTMVGGIIAESTTPNVELMVLKVINNKGTASTLNVMDAIQYAANKGADIINMSMGGFYKPAEYALIDEYLAEAAKKGALLCACSGNGSNGTGLSMTTAEGDRYYPAASDYTVSVGSIDSSGQRAASSNFGPELDFAVPGVDLELADYTTVKGYHTGKSGTSFACPYICACAAFLRMDSENNSPDTIRNQMEQISVDLGEEGRDDMYGYGMPNFSNDSAISPIELTGPLDLKVNTKKFAYDGEVKRPAVTITSEGRVLVSYDLTYPDENAKIGTHDVVAELQGNYTEPITLSGTFDIVPSTVNVKKATYNQAGSKIKIKWTKSQGSYQVLIAGNKKFNNATKYNTSDQQMDISDIKAGKTYYVKVRAIKKIKDENYYSFWSDTCQVVDGTD